MGSGRADIAVELLRLLELAGVDPDEITPATRLDALYLDSLDYTEIRQALRDRFGVDVAPDELSGAMTVGEATDLVAAKVLRDDRAHRAE